ncbi:hypothetical protein [Mucilaginibacter sp. UR6-11]|uniref:hypothetical protein n=1 Tax=Mucilaginibacter sp. UR6-11 TaxID=1435644 RepID=UPI001E4B2A4B|nr:hypothetical protein [Mucilaginibacter sp. UR6-11]MCC8424217.1 hypothetical protein [Mucilaginibacter sp. UR6-11]
MCTIDWDILAKFATLLTSLIAIYISIVALKRNTRLSTKNINLSIQQAIFKIVAEKARDCNNVWKNEPEFELKSKDSPHFLVITELVISIEIINNAFLLFDKNSEVIEEFKDTYFSLLWKQLIPDIRGWVQNVTPTIKANHNDKFLKQVATVHENFSKYFD